MAKFLTLAQLQKEFGIALRSLRDVMEREIYDPVKSVADQAKTLADSVRRDADEGRFNGAPGPQGPKGEPGDVSEAELTGKLAGKVDKEGGKMLSSNDYTDADKAKVEGLPGTLVSSVNGKTGAAELNAEDVGARADTWMPTAAQVGARDASTPIGTGDLAAGAVTDYHLVSVPGTAVWSPAGAVKVTTISADWVTAGDTIVFDIQPLYGEWADNIVQQEDWGKLAAVLIADGELTFVATEAFTATVYVGCLRVKR